MAGGIGSVNEEGGSLTSLRWGKDTNLFGVKVKVPYRGWLLLANGSECWPSLTAVTLYTLLLFIPL